MFPYQLRTDLLLELVEARHADELFAVTEANREHLRKWLPWVDGTRAPEDTRSFIDACLRQLADNNGFQTAIRFRGALVGMVGHIGINWQNRASELGYWLAEEAQGQGIMTEACRAYVSHAFSTIGLHRLMIRCAVDNKRSRAIPERLGFTLEGVSAEAHRLYDQYVDLAIYAMLSSGWKG